MPDFGSCWSCLTGLTFPAVQVTGFRVVAEAIVRRWSTPRGGLVDDPNYGFDLTGLVGDDIDTPSLSRMAQSASAEAKKDGRVLGCAVQMNYLDGALTVTASVTTAQGPFRLVVGVDNVTVSLLQVTP
jgi:phage baseplate assembly protein W